MVRKQVLINVSPSSTVLELKRLLAAEISGDLKIEVLSDNVDLSVSFVLDSQLLSVHKVFRI